MKTIIMLAALAMPLGLATLAEAGPLRRSARIVGKAGKAVGKVITFPLRRVRHGGGCGRSGGCGPGGC
jgi:hypothetical protein